MLASMTAEVDDSAAREQWAADVVLGNGDTAHIRPITPDDAPALAAFHARQSSESIYRRFFSPKPGLTAAELEHFTNVDFADRVALVVERNDEFVAWASYERWPGRDDADAAFMVDDREQGKGIATLLLEHLAAIARSNGIHGFTAEVLADNRPMLAVFSRAGWPIERRFESGVIDLDFPLADTSEFVDSVERREQRADSRAMARLLLPRSIAVVGASDRPGSIGKALWDHVTSGATPTVYAVNPNHAMVGGRRSWPSIRAIPADVSLAIVAVPASTLADTIRDCISARVRGAVIVTAVDGADFDVQSLVGTARRHGVRLVGPASMGIASPLPDVGLAAALVPMILPPGSVAISLQSGSLGASVLRLAAELSMGISWFVSLGDRSDVSGNDLLQFWEDDEATTVIAMYTESLGNPRKFARIARRVSRRRPIVAVRTGAAAMDPGSSALYQQAGLIEVPTVTAMLDTARVLATQPIARGPNVAVLANARSPGTLARAAIKAAGLSPVDPPVAIDWRATADDFGAALQAALDDDTIDAVMVIHAPPVAELVANPVEEIDRVAAGAAKPVVGVLLGGGDGPIRKGSAVPAFSFPEPAAAVLGRSYAYGCWLSTEAAAAAEPVTHIDRAAATAVINSALARADTVLTLDETITLLDAYGVGTPPARLVAAAEASAAAAEIGYPVAIKARHRHVGRSVEAGVALDLTDADDVAASMRVMAAALGADADEVVVQAMTKPGLDLRIRCRSDGRLGPVIAVGIGGSQAGDLIDDEPSRLAPLSSAGADALVAGSRVGPALTAAGIDPAPVAELLLRVAQLAADHPQLVAVDLNPVIASTDGCWVTDSVVEAREPTQPEHALRRME